MIILYNGYCGHSNRLFQNLHFEAFCYDNNIEYVNPSFFDLSEFYVSPVASKKVYISKFLRAKPIRLLLKFVSFKNIKSFNHESAINKKILLECSKNNNCYVDGWGFRAQDLTAKYQDLFAKRYALKDKSLTKINRETTAIVGVHIRRGDYITWMGGKYYFDDNIYKKNIRNLEDKVSENFNKKCVFIVFSNDATEFDDNANTFVSKNDWYIDHFLMGMCDYLIGPPSTFTLWASYIGKTKYYHIRDDSGDIDINKFEYCKG